MVVGSTVRFIVGLSVGTGDGANVSTVGIKVGVIVGDLLWHEFLPEQIWFNDNISWQNIPLKHVFSPKQSILTFPSFEQISKFVHESSDIQSISICCVCNAKILKSSHES